MSRPALDDSGLALAARRRQVIRDLVARQQYVTITEIRAATGASASTVHRDLAHLAEAGAVRRIWGGVTQAPPVADELADLRRWLTTLPGLLDNGDLDTVQRLLSQALRACERLRAGGR